MKHRIGICLALVALVAAMLGLVPVEAGAAPAAPMDETKVPHYFGPYPNYANSPLTMPDVTVPINGDGVGATATATVGANGAVTGITITDPGSGYTSATGWSSVGPGPALRHRPPSLRPGLSLQSAWTWRGPDTPSRR